MKIKNYYFSVIIRNFTHPLLISFRHYYLLEEITCFWKHQNNIVSRRCFIFQQYLIFLIDFNACFH